MSLLAFVSKDAIWGLFCDFKGYYRVPDFSIKGTLIGEIGYSPPLPLQPPCLPAVSQRLPDFSEYCDLRCAGVRCLVPRTLIVRRSQPRFLCALLCSSQLHLHHRDIPETKSLSAFDHHFPVKFLDALNSSQLCKQIHSADWLLSRLCGV